MKLTVTSVRGKEIGTVDIADNATLNDLKVAYKNLKRTGVERQAFYLVGENGARGAVIKGDVPLNTLVKNGDKIIFKDLGPQVGYRTVFLVEYFGPLTAFPIIYALRPYLYSSYDAKNASLNYTQTVAMLLFIVHFLKREFETIFVHKFSNGYMPLLNIFKNTGYYTACAYYIAYYTLHPLYVAPGSDNWTNIFAGLVVLMMICNLICHIILSNLRPRGTTVRRIPKGFLFNLVSCPNYTVEISEWFFFSLMTMTVASFLFTLVGGGQMLVWAIKKHINYRKEFNGKDGKELYPRSRKIIIPFLY